MVLEHSHRLGMYFDRLEKRKVLTCCESKDRLYSPRKFSSAGLESSDRLSPWDPHLL
jgi:hypothetical protein